MRKPLLCYHAANDVMQLQRPLIGGPGATFPEAQRNGREFLAPWPSACLLSPLCSAAPAVRQLHPIKDLFSSTLKPRALRRASMAL